MATPAGERKYPVLLSPEAAVPDDHPLRGVKRLADAALRDIPSPIDSPCPRDGIGRGQIDLLLKGSLLIALYSLRSDPGLCEQLRYNLLFRWFLDMDLTGEPPEASAFAMDRKRLVSEGASRGFFRRVITQARAEHLIGPEHFTVNEALLATWGTAERVTRAKALASLASAAPSDLVASTSTLPPGGTSMICRIGAAFEPTPRQTEILEGLSEGLANKELALRLGCSIRNVEYHVGQILRKAGYSSRLELVAQMWGRAPSRGTGSRTSAG